jgi:hypothetical protein
MILKFSFILFVISATLLAQTYTFIEQRYSDALEKSFTLNGKISFLKEDALEIEYPQKNRSILYENGIVSLSEDGNLIEISEQEEQGIIRYFKILLVVHEGDQALLKKEFSIKKIGDRMELLPKGYIKNFLSKITLKGFGKDLQEVTLFMQNLDRITIKIEDEIS